MATPMVAGICALILSSQSSKHFSPTELIELIKATDDTINGFKILDGDAAVELADECHFATDYNYAEEISSQANIQPYLIYGTDSYEDFGLYANWNYDDQFLVNQRVLIKLYSRVYF